MVVNIVEREVIMSARRGYCPGCGSIFTVGRLAVEDIKAGMLSLCAKSKRQVLIALDS